MLHGGARGADKLAGTVAAKLGFEVEEYEAEWNTYGKAAGALRNIKMIETEPDLVIAFWDGASAGTKHTLSLARKAGIPTKVHESTNVG